MITWNKDHFDDVFGASLQEQELENFTDDGPRGAYFRYETELLKYDIMVDEDQEQVGVSADTVMPFGADSLYEIYVPCRRIVFKSGEFGRKFQFAFFREEKESNEALSLTIAVREKDRNLVVWPYYRWDGVDNRNQQGA